MSIELEEQKTLNLQELQKLQKDGNFDIKPCEENLENKRGLKRLNVSGEQARQICGLAAQAPSIAGTAAMSNAWVVKFPEGVSGTLMHLNTGGLSTSVVNESGQIVATAALFRPTPQMAVLGAFTVMSVISGQYFLSQINSEMKKMNDGINKILDFLYTDKKTELISESMFVKYAYENYHHIAPHREQRLATLTNLQSAKKVAVKDIEFYINDLDTTVKEKKDGFDKKALQTKESLELAMQLYTISTILEAYYSENFDNEYTEKVKEEAKQYIKKCDNRISSRFSEIKGIVGEKNKIPIPIFKKEYSVEQISEVINERESGKDSELISTIESAFSSAVKESEYYITNKGEVYMKV